MAVALAPYLLAAFVNSRLWTRQAPRPVEVVPGIWLGRLPSRGELRNGGFRSLVDLSAELPVAQGELAYRAVPMLDLLVPEPEQVAAAARAIEELERRRGRPWFSAPSAYSRSAAAVAAWLLHDRPVRGRAGGDRPASPRSNRSCWAPAHHRGAGRRRQLSQVGRAEEEARQVEKHRR